MIMQTGVAPVRKKRPWWAKVIMQNGMLTGNHSAND